MPILFVPLGITISFKLSQPLKAPTPMLSRLSGISMLSRLLQPSKSPSLKSLIPLAMLTLFRFSHLLNTFLPKYFTCSGITNSATFLPLGYKRITSLFLLYKTPSSLENSLLFSSTIIFSKLSHPLKQGNASLELLSIFFIFSDSVIFFNVLQSVNVSSPMDTTFFPSITTGTTTSSSVPVYFIIYTFSPFTTYSQFDDVKVSFSVALTPDSNITIIEKDNNALIKIFEFNFAFIFLPPTLFSILIFITFMLNKHNVIL